MQDTRLFLTMGFRNKVMSNISPKSPIPRNPKKVCIRIVCGKGKPYAEYKNLITGEVWKEEV